MFNFKLDPLVCYNTLLLLSFNSLIWIPWKSKFELLQVYKTLSNYTIRNTVLMVTKKSNTIYLKKSSINKFTIC